MLRGGNLERVAIGTWANRRLGKGVGKEVRCGLSARRLGRWCDIAQRLSDSLDLLLPDLCKRRWSVAVRDSGGSSRGTDLVVEVFDSPFWNEILFQLTGSDGQQPA